MHIRELAERVKKVKVVRGGKVQKVNRSTRDGFKVKDGKEVKQTSQEKIKLKKAQKKGALKRKSTKAIANLRRQKSIKKRSF